MASKNTWKTKKEIMVPSAIDRSVAMTKKRRKLIEFQTENFYFSTK